MSDTNASEDEKATTKDGIPIRDRPAWKTIRDLLPYMWLEGRWDLRRRVIGAFLLVALSRALVLTLPFVYKDIIDSLAGDASVETLLMLTPIALILVYGSLEILTYLSFEGQDLLMINVREALYRTLSSRALSHLNSLSLQFHIQKRAASLAGVVERGAAHADDLVQMALFQIIPMTLEFIVIITLIVITFGWDYAAVVAVIAVLYLGFTLAAAEWQKRFHRDYIEARQDTDTKFHDTITNMESVKNFTNEFHEEERYDRSHAVLEGATVRHESSYVISDLGQATIYYAGLTVLMIMVAQEIAAGAATVGSLVLLTSLASQFYRPIEIFAMVYRNIRQALIDSEQLLSLMTMTSDVADPPEPKALAVRGGEVCFESVRFGYVPGQLALRDVSFTVLPGCKVAIVGRSGAGKSTIANLLLRHFDVAGGRILIDGQDIRTVTQASLRDAIGIVPQETALFNDTIAYNVAYGRPGASQDEIVEAAKLAQLHDAIMAKEHGYESIVGERGLKLSGGEKQRVAIARALLKNPPILVLDEATSSLDTRTEQDIQTALDRASLFRTTLVIAHRLSTVMNADQILVLDDGVIAERGTHKELLAKGGLYAAMWQRQSMAADTDTQDED